MAISEPLAADATELAAIFADVQLSDGRAPLCIRAIVENSLARFGNAAILRTALSAWRDGTAGPAIPLAPNRILMQDTAGVATLADLAAYRERVAPGAARHRDIPIDLVVDHSLSVEVSGSADAAAINLRLELKRSAERNAFFQWMERALPGLRVYPPGSGICHQVNLEHLATIVDPVAAADGLKVGEFVIGTDSHTTMINALGVLGWGVGGIEALAAALGEPLEIRLPKVMRVQIVGRRRPGVTATDIALHATRLLRSAGCTGWIVEFTGPGLDDLSLADRAALSNMAPEYGATCASFPIDEEVLRYLQETGRAAAHIDDVRKFAQTSGRWRDDSAEPLSQATLSLDLAHIEPILAGPSRPQQSVALSGVRAAFLAAHPKAARGTRVSVPHGAVAIAAITSCTNTANLPLLAAAGLVARRARKLGLRPPAWTKASFAPGSQAAARFVRDSGLQDDLDAIGFHFVGTGCTTCVGNSGPLSSGVAEAIRRNGISTCAVLSGNRNFERRVHPDIVASFLASPPLVVAYALAGTALIDLSADPVSRTIDGAPVFLRELLPDDGEVAAFVAAHRDTGRFREAYDMSRLRATSGWPDPVKDSHSGAFPWDPTSTFVRRPPFFDRTDAPIDRDIVDARILLALGDDVTTDHISPIGRIIRGTPAADYLYSLGVPAADWGTYGDRRANHEVMRRGAFCHPRLGDRLTGTPAFERAEMLRARGDSVVIVAGQNYGMGSARDWAAKATALLGVRAVLAASFERIHRANLIALGVLPVLVDASIAARAWAESDRIGVRGIDRLSPDRNELEIEIADGAGRIVHAGRGLIDTPREAEALRAGGLFALLRRIGERRT